MVASRALSWRVGAGEFREREVEGEARFGALVLVEVILQQRVAAAAGGGIVERLAEIVAAEEPLEAAPRRLAARTRRA